MQKHKQQQEQKQEQKQARCVCAGRCGDGVADVQPLSLPRVESSRWMVVEEPGKDRRGPSQKGRDRAGAGLVD